MGGVKGGWGGREGVGGFGIVCLFLFLVPLC